jgi:uncharacterized phage-associated protein
MGKVIFFKHSNGGMYMEVNIRERKENLLEITKLILFFANKSSIRLYKTKLNKLLFYTQFLCYKDYGKRLIEDEFIKDHHGPVLEHIDVYLEVLSNLKLINLVETDYGLTIESNFNLDVNEYSDIERNVLNRVLERFNMFTASDISEYSHRESLWKNTPMKQIINLNRASELNEFYQ